jgi:threonylcarbamoyladenosine tRNA methylthiotransferase MtaB
VSTYYVENFGCRATQADGAALERQLEQRGLSRAATPAQATVVVMNTCTVTAAADQDARAAIRRVRRQNPEAQIVVTGCYAQRAPKEIAALPGVTLVIGNSHKHQLAEIVSREAATECSPQPALSLLRGRKPWEKTTTASAPAERKTNVRPDSLSPAKGEEAPLPQALGFIPLTTVTQPGSRRPEAGSPIFVSDIFAHTELQAAPVFEAANARTRPNLKVQDGCDNRCSFCVIPSVRGQSRSLPIDQILVEVNALVNSGYREVVISGINLGRWGRDLSADRLLASGFWTNLTDSENVFRNPRAESRKPTFESLLRAILGNTSLEKLRISSVEPMDWTDELISLVASSPRIAKHAHVPLQSGSDAVLRRMHRKYRPWHYREKIEKIRAAMPTAAIGADVMVGFPGETTPEFEATRRMIEDLPFTYLHVFTYSPRPSTPAASMPNQVAVHLARERNKILRELAAEKKLAFMRSFVGKELEAITLSSCGAGARAREASTTEFTNQAEQPSTFTEALTENYLKLLLPGYHAPNRWLRAQIEDVADGTLVGRAHDTPAEP